MSGAERGADRTGQNGPVRVAIGADHAGFRLKVAVSQYLSGSGHELVDFGTDSEEPVDYPPFCVAVARAVAGGSADRGVVIGGSGQGEAIVANKVPGVRAALCLGEFTARLARSHNDANVLALGGRIVAEGLALLIVDLFLSTPFDGGRHARRLAQIAEIESEEARALEGRASQGPAVSRYPHRMGGEGWTGGEGVE